MKRNILFHIKAFEDYLYWQSTDDKLFEKINELLKDINRDPYRGLGKPEPLKNEYTGYWSRRINLEHRLIYKITDAEIIIASCRYHY
jgi:toxin YoeB